jgi:hypothetical protein
MCVCVCLSVCLCVCVCTMFAFSMYILSCVCVCARARACITCVCVYIHIIIQTGMIVLMDTSSSCFSYVFDIVHQAELAGFSLPSSSSSSSFDHVQEMLHSFPLGKNFDFETPQDTIESSVICSCVRSGAKAVLFASDSEIVKLYTPYQVPVNLTIPTLSVQRSFSNHIFDALSMDRAVTCHFPGSVPPNHWKYDST